jgi:Co/Zn/Cd efflux system component
MAEIMTRHVEESTKHTLMMMAGALGVSLNDLCVWIFEEAAMPHEELRDALLQRANDVHSSRGKLTIRKYDSVPSPRTPTRPFEGK